MGKGKKQQEMEEEPQGPSKKELRAQKKAQKAAALDKLKDTKAEQDRMLGINSSKIATDTAEAVTAVAS